MRLCSDSRCTVLIIANVTLPNEDMNHEKICRRYPNNDLARWNNAKNKPERLCASVLNWFNRAIRLLALKNCIVSIGDYFTKHSSDNLEPAYRNSRYLFSVFDSVESITYGAVLRGLILTTALLQFRRFVEKAAIPTLRNTLNNCDSSSKVKARY